MIRLAFPLFFSAALFSIGVYGVLARRNGVLVLMSIELMLNAVNVNLVAFSQFLQDEVLTGSHLHAVRDHRRRCGGRDRPGHRDPDLPEPRDHQRGRGQPPQVVGQVEHAAASGGGLVDLAWLIPVLPLVSFFLISFFGKRLPVRGASLGILAVGIPWVMSAVLFFQFITESVHGIERSLTWFELGSFHVELGMSVDGVTAMMFLVVTTVSLLVHIYSVSYMEHEPRFTWYYAALSLFTGSMLTLVIANNLFQMLVGWELVGVCSYLLIGHFWEEKENSDAAIKAFITTRTGDVPFVFGIFVLTVAAGTANIGEINLLAEDGGIAVGRADRRSRAAVRRGGRQVGAVPAPRVAPRRHGRPHPGVRADPRGDDGGRRGVHGRPDVPGVRSFRQRCRWSP